MLGRMFTMHIRSTASGNSILDSGADLVRPNERNEYEVADGLSASCFRAIMVFNVLFYINSRIIIIMDI